MFALLRASNIKKYTLRLYVALDESSVDRVQALLGNVWEALAVSVLQAQHRDEKTDCLHPEFSVFNRRQGEDN